MLSKMGWTSGQALGKHKNGIVEPVRHTRYTCIFKLCNHRNI